MPIHVKLFGDLRKKIDETISGTASLRLNVDDPEIERISDFLKKFNIGENEVYHIFVNTRYAGLTKKVKDGDKVSLFPANMSVLYKWYFKREENE